LKSHGLSYHKQKPLRNRAFHRRIEQCWERIFDLDWRCKDFTRPRDEKMIQATLWQLEKAMIIRVTPFIGR
jgi:hypothetical protein